jgi:hypothetical protein
MFSVILRLTGFLFSHTRPFSSNARREVMDRNPPTVVSRRAHGLAWPENGTRTSAPNSISRSGTSLYGVEIDAGGISV